MSHYRHVRIRFVAVRDSSRRQSLLSRRTSVGLVSMRPRDRSDVVPGFPEPAKQPPLRPPHIGERCRVEGVLHDYLGAAVVPGGEDILHVFARREWLPGSGEQPPVTLVGPEDLETSVSLIRRSAL